MYKDQSVKLKLYPGRQEVWRMEDEFYKDAAGRRLFSTFTANALPRKPLKGLETSKLEEK